MPAADSLLKKFRNFREHTLQEKVYLHLDNGFYIAGEQIYVSAYLVDGAFHKPLVLSKVIYVELLDQTNKAIAHAKIEMKGGRGNGIIAIPAIADSGPYVVRAYTHWMKNFSADFFYQQSVSIVNPFKQLERAEVKNEKEILVNFFPEGGNLIANLSNKVAFKITDHSGHGLAWKGFLTEKGGADTIVRFSPLRYGLGSFVFKPGVGKQYAAYIIDPEGKTRSYDLPRVYPSGYRMQVTENESTVRVEVAAANPGESTADVYLFAHARNIIENAERKSMTNGVVVFELDKKTLREGISHLTLFDAQFQPQCQRLFFKPVTNLLSISMTRKASIRTREKFEFRIHTQETGGNGMQANLSIAVYRADSLAVVNDDGIAEYLWLTSDLKGFIEDPSYYFRSNSDREMSDLLMLTHGWSRFRWNDVLAGTPTLTFLPEYAGHMISVGVQKSNGESAAPRLIWLSSPDRVVKTHTGIVNTKGEAHFQTYGLYGARSLIIQSSILGEDLKFTLSSPFSTSFSSFTNREFNISRKNRSALMQRSVAMQTRPLYDRELIPRTTNSKDTLPFYGNADNRYRLDDYTRFPVLEEVLREYVPNVRVRKRNDGFHFIVNNENTGGLFSEDPLILLDGVPVSATQILSYNPLNIQRLDVMTHRYFFGSASASGIVSFVTYKGDLNQMQIDPSAFQINYQGLQQQAEYFTPIYETTKQKTSPVPDLRYLQYWNGSALTNKNGTYSTSFYTSDVKGKYVIVVEGLSSDGKAGRTVETFEVVE
jgi:hypothetical protein